LIGHFGGSVVDECFPIRRDFSVSQEVMISQKSRGEYGGCPATGDVVYVGPGACASGSGHIGFRVVVVPRAVVIFDVEHGDVGGGGPAHPISRAGTSACMPWPA
jgi:serine acetyltransferase